MTAALGGWHAVVAALMNKEIPSDKSLSPEIVDDMQTILHSHPKVGVKLWVLAQVINEEFQTFWKKEEKAKEKITALLCSALTLADMPMPKQASNLPPGSNPCWLIHRFAQRIIYSLAKELDMAVLLHDLQNIIATHKVEDMGYHWALLILIKFKLGDVDKYLQLGRDQFISVPAISEQLRNDILKYYAPYPRAGMHPKWLVEALIKGYDLKDDQPYWATYGEKHVNTTQEYQDKINEKLGDGLIRTEFLHSSDKLHEYDGIGTYAGMFILCDYDESVGFLLSEVGPYATLTIFGGNEFPEALDNSEPNQISAEAGAEKIQTCAEQSGVKILTEEELEVNLSELGFSTYLGPRWIPHTVHTLLFFWSE